MCGTGSKAENERKYATIVDASLSILCGVISFSLPLFPTLNSQTLILTDLAQSIVLSLSSLVAIYFEVTDARTTTKTKNVRKYISRIVIFKKDSSWLDYLPPIIQLFGSFLVFLNLQGIIMLLTIIKLATQFIFKFLNCCNCGCKSNSDELPLN